MTKIEDFEASLPEDTRYQPTPFGLILWYRWFYHKLGICHRGIIDIGTLRRWALYNFQEYFAPEEKV